jgi:hypothetical protein
MKIYLSLGNIKRMKGYIEKNNLGWCISPDYIRDPKGLPYFLDNGAFHSWKHKTKWD